MGMNEGLRESGRSTFNKQFSHRDNIEVYGGSAETVDITPDRKTDKPPVLVAPAWSCSIDVYKGALNTLAKEGRRALSLNHPRGAGNPQSLERRGADVSAYPQAEVLKALNILDFLDAKGLDQIDVVAHSEAGIHVAIAAMIDPKKFRNIVFFAPAGLIGEDTPARLAKGFAGQQIKEVSFFPPKIKFQGRPESLAAIPVSQEARDAALAEGRIIPDYAEIPKTPEEEHAAQAAGKGLMGYVREHPIRSIQEGLAMAHTRIEDLLQTLHDKGIGIVIMSGVDDPVFQTEKMTKMVNSQMIDGFLSIRGGHGEIGGHPRFMTAAEQMLSALEAKKKNRPLPTTGTSGE